MKKIMKEKNQVVPDEVLSKEFISQFKTGYCFKECVWRRINKKVYRFFRFV